MPFDGIGFAFDDRVSRIDQVISLLDTRDKWCKGNFKTPDGIARSTIGCRTSAPSTAFMAPRMHYRAPARWYIRLQAWVSLSRTN